MESEISFQCVEVILVLTGQVVNALVGDWRLAQVNRLEIGQVLRDEQKAFVAELFGLI